MGRNSHRTRTANYSEREYLAFARAILGGDFDKVNLERPLRSLQEYAFQPVSLTERQREVEVLALLLRSLSLWYIIREDLEQGRFPIDSPQFKVAERFAGNIVSICAPQMVSFLMNGHHETLRKLAAVVEAAKTMPLLGDQSSQDKKLRAVNKALGLKIRKPHKATGRIRLLLPLWMLGFGDLPQTKRYEILEKAGLNPEEIPEDDALRQILSYYKIPSIRKILRGIRNSKVVKEYSSPPVVVP